VKRRELKRHLRKHGARKLREGGNHSFWAAMPSARPPIPRHLEIGVGLTRKICKDLGIPVPTGSR